MGWKYPEDRMQKALKALEEAGGNKTEAARILDMPRTTYRETLDAAIAWAGGDFCPPDPQETGEDDELLTRGKTEYSEQGNYAEVTYKGPFPRTVEGLLDTCQVDMDGWNIERKVVNQWDMGAKTKEGNIIVTPLYQVKVWLVRKVAQTVEFPHIVPNNLTISVPKFKKPEKDPHQKVALIIPDSQNGYINHGRYKPLEPIHDRCAWDICMQLADMVQPDRVALLGDHADATEWTDKYLQGPEFADTTQPTIDELNWLLGRIRIIVGQDTPIDYVPGNHEVRMDNMVIKHLVAAYGLKPANAPDEAPAALSWENLLRLPELDIKMHDKYPKGELHLTPDLAIGHGEIVRSGSGDTVKAICNEIDISYICGHIHRVEMACRTWHRNGKTYVSRVMSPGTLARTTGEVPAAKKRNNWQKGAALVHYRTDGSKDVQFEPIFIQGNRALFRGHLIVGCDYIGELERDTGRKF